VTARQIAVCVPAYRDPEGVRRLLGCLAGVDHPADSLRVVIAVDGGDPETVQAAAAGGAEALALPKAGSYAARNAALDHLGNWPELVVFTDADCLPQRAWIREHLAAIDAGIDLSGGAVEVTLRQKASPAEYVDRMRHLKQEMYVTALGFAVTANLAVRRTILDDHRFADRLQTGGDVEFCRRAVAAGYTLGYTPNAVVQHPARTTSKDVLTKVRRICAGMADQPERWVGTPVSKARIRRAPVTIARAEGVSQGLLWDAREIALEWYCQWTFVRHARRYGAVVR
jgi:cellulose synthase/poly-beta-1,6-N-acetylglucosamine synthase-like glycosyltransferase